MEQCGIKQTSFCEASLGRLAVLLRLSRRDKIILCHSCIGHTLLTHSFILAGVCPPQWEVDGHILVRCPHQLAMVYLEMRVWWRRSDSFHNSLLNFLGKPVFIRNLFFIILLITHPSHSDVQCVWCKQCNHIYLNTDFTWPTLNSSVQPGMRSQ